MHLIVIVNRGEGPNRRLVVAKHPHYYDSTQLLTYRLNFPLRCSCGIEHLLSSGTAKRRSSHRREHVIAIVSRQDTCTAEELRSRSRHSSRLARYNAHCLAVSTSRLDTKEVQCSVHIGVGEQEQEVNQTMYKREHSYTNELLTLLLILCRPKMPQQYVMNMVCNAYTVAVGHHLSYDEISLILLLQTFPIPAYYNPKVSSYSHDEKVLLLYLALSSI